MPISAIDAISPAFNHTRQQLTQPFRPWQWARLALVGLIAGELSSGGGCNFSGFQIPQPGGGSRQLVATGLPAGNPMLFAILIGLLVVLGVVLWFSIVYANSVMRFVLFDAVVTKECHIRRSWAARQRPGLRYFGWQLLVMVSLVMGLTILVGIPALIALGLGWWEKPGAHIVPLVLGGIFFFFLLFALFITILVVAVLTKDFVVPQMALENINAFEGWRRLWPMMKADKGGYAGYIGMKIVMALGAAMVIGILATIVTLLIAVPLGGLGAIAVLMGKTAGMTWNAYTITLAVVAGAGFLVIVLYTVALISVPAVVFFPAYGIYFLASRYPALDAVLHPLPPAPEPPPSPPPPPELPPFPPEPSPIV